MKKVVDVSISKDGDEIVTFRPTPLMQLFAIKKSEFPGMGDEDVAEKAGIDRQNPGRWRTKYGSRYLEWLEEYVETNTNGNDAVILERIGMLQATQSGNFQYWKEMAKKHGVIKDEVKETTNISINTDFSAIMVGDFDEARRRILEAYRGVADQGGSRVVDVAHERLEDGSPSPGAGASPVQDGPLAVADPLGEDRGHAEQGAAVPAIPGKSTP